MNIVTISVTFLGDMAIIHWVNARGDSGEKIGDLNNLAAMMERLIAPNKMQP